MLLRSVCALLLLTIFFSPTGFASGEDDQRAIIGVLNKSADDWNRGDLEAFARSYKQGPDAELVGPTNVYGFDAILGRYRKHYPDAAATGKLTFSDLEVRRLDERFATVTGHFHLIRSAAGGGNQDGYFLLVMEKTAAGWRIVRDASVGLPQKK